jgi:hypothetical protein
VHRQDLSAVARARAIARDTINYNDVSKVIRSTPDERDQHVGAIPCNRFNQ